MLTVCHIKLRACGNTLAVAARKAGGPLESSSADEMRSMTAVSWNCSLDASLVNSGSPEVMDDLADSRCAA